MLGDLIVTGRRSEDLAFVERLEAIEGSLWIYENPELVELPGFLSLQHLGGSLSIADNRVLATVSGFPVLSDIPGALYVAENPKLDGLEVGTALTSAGSIFFSLNPSLSRFDGLQGLTLVEGDVRVAYNSGLTTLLLPALVTVGGGLLLVENARLGTADFSAVRSVDQLSIAGNAMLVSLPDFGSLERATLVTIESNNALEVIDWTASEVARVFISDNARLERITGTPSALTSSGHLFIEGNPVLNSLEGFLGVKALDTLRVADNPALPEISAFGELTQVGDLHITNNLAFVGPSEWFPRLNLAARDVWIFGNPSLAPTIVDAFIARVDITGDIRVGDNESQETSLDPCPWPMDGICDTVFGSQGPGTGLCLADPEDCDG